MIKRDNVPRIFYVHVFTYASLRVLRTTHPAYLRN